MKVTEISKELGKQWNDLSLELKSVNQVLLLLNVYLSFEEFFSQSRETQVKI